MSTTNNRRASGTRSRNQSSASGRSRTSGSRASQNVKTSAAQRARRNTRRRKPSPDYKKIAIIGVVLILLIAGAVFAAKQFKGKEPAVTTAEETETETKLVKPVTVDGVNITGLSREAAKDKLMKHYKWGMKVNYEDAETPYEVPNLIEPRIDTLLEEIYKGEAEESYTLDTRDMAEEARAEVETIANQWDVKAQNGAIAGFDKGNGSFIYSGEKSGKLINRESLEADMKTALSSGQFDAVLTAKGVTVEPEITEAQAKEMYKVLGTMTTTTTSNKDRNTNIQIACDALDGLIIQPGEEFSFNETTGNRTIEKGYKPAGAYVNGVLVEEPGGGVCQVSSTMYNAVVFSGLTTTERHAHSYEPSYVIPGEDAMVSYDGYAGPDMKFVNNSKDAVAIRAKFADRKLTISIVGIPILEEGEKWYMKSEKTEELEPPEPVYEENQALEPDVEKVVKQAVNGSRWITNLVKEKDGVIISDEHLHKSTYKGKAATIQRNTSGVVIPETVEGETPSESQTEIPTGVPAAPDGQTGEAPAETSGSDAAQGPGGQTTPSSPTTAAPQGPGENSGGPDQSPHDIAPNPFS